jgi:putative glutamine amidotransferase
MADRPRIALPVPTTIDPAYNERSWKNYADAVTEAGGEAVAIDPGSTEARVRRLAAGCDGFLLPGSPADVDPGRYGADREDNCGPADVGREQADWAMLDEAERAGKPVLGVCYGIQSMNTWSGGTLIQDLAPLPVNHSAGGKVAVAHSVAIAVDSLLGSIVGGAEDCAPDAMEGFLRLPVNSSHHQAVGVPGDSVRMTARCTDDGVLEAIERPWSKTGDWWVIGVQWHPERSTAISGASRALFAAFVAEAARFAASRTEPQTQVEASAR